MEDRKSLLERLKDEVLTERGNSETFLKSLDPEKLVEIALLSIELAKEERPIREVDRLWKVVQMTFGLLGKEDRLSLLWETEELRDCNHFLHTLVQSGCSNYRIRSLLSSIPHHSCNGTTFTTYCCTYHQKIVEFLLKKFNNIIIPSFFSSRKSYSSWVELMKSCYKCLPLTASISENIYKSVLFGLGTADSHLIDKVLKLLEGTPTLIDMDPPFVESILEVVCSKNICQFGPRYLKRFINIFGRVLDKHHLSDSTIALCSSYIDQLATYPTLNSSRSLQFSLVKFLSSWKCLPRSSLLSFSLIDLPETWSSIPYLKSAIQNYTERCCLEDSLEILKALSHSSAFVLVIQANFSTLISQEAMNELRDRPDIFLKIIDLIGECRIKGLVKEICDTTEKIKNFLPRIINCLEDGQTELSELKQIKLLGILNLLWERAERIEGLIPDELACRLAHPESLATMQQWCELLSVMLLHPQNDGSVEARFRCPKSIELFLLQFEPDGMFTKEVCTKYFQNLVEKLLLQIDWRNSLGLSDFAKTVCFAYHQNLDAAPIPEWFNVGVFWKKRFDLSNGLGVFESFVLQRHKKQYPNDFTQILEAVKSFCDAKFVSLPLEEKYEAAHFLAHVDVPLMSQLPESRPEIGSLPNIRLANGRIVQSSSACLDWGTIVNYCSIRRSNISDGEIHLPDSMLPYEECELFTMLTTSLNYEYVSSLDLKRAVTSWQMSMRLQNSRLYNRCIKHIRVSGAPWVDRKKLYANESYDIAYPWTLWRWFVCLNKFLPPDDVIKYTSAVLARKLILCVRTKMFDEFHRSLTPNDLGLLAKSLTAIIESCNKKSAQ